MLKTLIDKVDNIEEQIGNISKEEEMLRKKQKEMLELKKFVTEMKNGFDGLINRSDTVKEIVSESEDTAIVTSQTKMQRERKRKL